MRVAILHNIPSPNRIALFRKLAAQEGITLRVFFSAQREKNRHWLLDLSEDAWAHFLDGRTFNFGRKDLIAIHYNSSAISEFARFHPDVIILGGYNSPTHLQLVYYCLHNRIPYILWNGSTLNEDNLVRRLTSPLIRFIVRGASAYIAYGTKAADYLKTLGATEDRIFYGYNTVDIEYFQSWADKIRPCRRQLRETLGIHESEKAVLFVGQLIERKGIRELLAVIRKLHNCGHKVRLMVAGTGPLEDELKNEFANVPVTWLGHVQPSKLPELYVAADVTVLPSREEVWGLVINEAMASGCPVIASYACGGTEDLIIDGVTGFKIPTCDSSCYSASIQAVLSSVLDLSPVELQQIAQNALDRLKQHFTIENAASRFVAAIRVALQS